MGTNDLERLETVNTARGDVELGYTEAIQQHYARHVVQRKHVSQRKLDFEASRPRWLRECMAEATGVFFYVYPGIASVCSLTLALGDPAEASIAAVYANFLQVGLAFGIGIAFAIIVCAPTSGGHFNPAVTLCLAYWQGFPWRKVPYFILSQILGSFMAAMIVMGQYHVQIKAFADASIAAGKGTVYNGGPASIFMSIPNPNQTNLGYLLFIEFFVDSFIGLVIWACLDPANPFVSPSSAPFAIGLAYSIMVWGFAPITISTNLARDLGCRIVAAIFYGGEVFTYGHYSWIAILINVPATFFATAYYEFLMRDSLRRIGAGGAKHEHGEAGIYRTMTRNGIGRESGESEEDQKGTEVGAMNVEMQ